MRVTVDDTKRLSIKDYRTRLYHEIKENVARVEAARAVRTNAILAASAGPPQASAATPAHPPANPEAHAGAASAHDRETPRKKGSSRRDPAPAAWQVEHGPLSGHSSHPAGPATTADHPNSFDYPDDRDQHDSAEEEEEEDEDIAALKALSFREPSSSRSAGSQPKFTPRSAAARNKKHSMREPTVAAAAVAGNRGPSKSRVGGGSASASVGKESGSSGAVRREVKTAQPQSRPSAAELAAAARADEPMMDVFGRRVGRKKASGYSQRNSSTIFGSPVVQTPPNAGVRRPSAEWRKSPEDIHRTVEAPLSNVYGQPVRGKPQIVVRPKVSAPSAGLPWGPRTNTQPW